MKFFGKTKLILGVLIVTALSVSSQNFAYTKTNTSSIKLITPIKTTEASIQAGSSDSSNVTLELSRPETVSSCGEEGFVLLNKNNTITDFNRLFYCDPIAVVMADNSHISLDIVTNPAKNITIKTDLKGPILKDYSQRKSHESVGQIPAQQNLEFKTLKDMGQVAEEKSVKAWQQPNSIEQELSKINIWRC